MLTILLPGYARTPIRFTSLLISQAINLVSCAVNFLNVGPFLHPHRLHLRQILKTMCLVGRFCCFKIHSFNVVVTRGYKVFSMII